MDNELTPTAEAPDFVFEKLAPVLQSRQEIAAVISSVAEAFPPPSRRRLISLGQWFGQPVTPQEVLLRPDVLAICLALARNADTPPEQWQIQDAVRTEFSAMNNAMPPVRRFDAVLVYPATLLALCVLLVVAFSVYLVPEFERMFNEFGLDLPAPTNFVIAMSHAIRDWGIVVFATLCLATVCLFGFCCSPRGSATIDGWFASTRVAIASWAWHVAVLLQAGLSQPDAIAFAGDASLKSRLKMQSTGWAAELRQGLRPFDRLAFLDGRPCHLLAHALTLDNVDDQSALLRGVAKMYWDRERLKSRWWLGLISPLTVCFTGWFIGLIVVALFMPLVSLISGLT